MGAYTFDYDKESITVNWDNGVLTAQGYDLENERLALTLSGGFGEGINVFLLALEEYMTIDKDLGQVIKGFQKHRKRYPAGVVANIWELVSACSHEIPPTSLFLLFSTYHPDASVRLACAGRGGFPGATWKRLLNDPDERVIYMALSRAQGPVSELRKNLKHPNPERRKSLAYNPNLSFSSMLALANDPVIEVGLAILDIDNIRTPPKAIRKVVGARKAEMQSARLEQKAIKLAKKALLWKKQGEELLKKPHEDLENTI